MMMMMSSKRRPLDQIELTLAVAPGQLLVSMSNTAYTAVYALGSAPNVPSSPPNNVALVASDLSAAAVASISVLVTAAVATIIVFALIKVGVLSRTTAGGAGAKRGDFTPLLETTSLRS